MGTETTSPVVHPEGEQPEIEAWSAVADTYAGRVHVEWDATAPEEGAELGYNPHKPGRPSHCYHTYMLSNLRLVRSVDVQPGDQHNVKHATGGL